MRNEAEFKKVFRNSVKAQHGYSIPLAAPMLSGVPDMYIILPGFIPVLLEAKWLGEIMKYDFDRKIPYTKLQRHFIEECNAVYNCTAMGLIGWKYSSNIFAALTIHERINTATANLVVMGPTFKRFDVKLLFEVSGVPRLNGVHT